MDLVRSDSRMLSGRQWQRQHDYTLRVGGRDRRRSIHLGVHLGVHCFHPQIVSMLVRQTREQSAPSSSEEYIDVGLIFASSTMVIGAFARRIAFRSGWRQDVYSPPDSRDVLHEELSEVPLGLYSVCVQSIDQDTSLLDRMAKRIITPDVGVVKRYMYTPVSI